MHSAWGAVPIGSIRHQEVLPTCCLIGCGIHHDLLERGIESWPGRGHMISYHQTVEVSPVLLVHGFASSAEHNWRQPGWLDVLADAGRETIAVDLLGHGTAPRPTDPAEYSSVEDRVAEQISGYEQVDAVGFSAGAHVLLRLAAERPGQFRRLALLGIGGSVLTGGGDGAAPIIAPLEGEPDTQK